MKLDLDEVPVATFPKSVQPGIPRLGPPKPGWAHYRFGDLLEVVMRPVRMLDESEYDLVTVKRSRGGIEKRATFQGSEISVKSQFRIEGGDFLISRRQIVHGACAVVPEAFSGSIVSNEYAVLRCKPDLDLDFLKYLTHSIYFQQTCFHSSIGVHVEKMIFKLEAWLDLSINIPSVDEQKRIGQGFAVIDSKIEALRQKKSGLEAFKSGLMQRLFSQDLRFTRYDGSDFPDWEDARLGDLIASLDAGVSVNSADGTTLEGTFGILKTSCVTSGRFDVYENKLVDDPVEIRRLKEPVRAGTVIISRMNTPQLVGANAYVARGADNIFLPDRLWAAKIRDGICAHWMGYLLGHPTTRSALSNRATGTSGSMKNLSKEAVLSLEVSVPHPDEQRKIADALSALDAKIAAVTDQISHMEIFKKGLLQQMFV